eukprot:1075592-Pelagomonas_calceolata.AAC.6
MGLAQRRRMERLARHKRVHMRVRLRTQEFLAKDSIDDLVAILTRAKVVNRLMEFMPQSKRTPEEFQAHFKVCVCGLLHKSLWGWPVPCTFAACFTVLLGKCEVYGLRMWWSSGRTPPYHIMEASLGMTEELAWGEVLCVAQWLLLDPWGQKKGTGELVGRGHLWGWCGRGPPRERPH